MIDIQFSFANCSGKRARGSSRDERVHVAVSLPLCTVSPSSPSSLAVCLVAAPAGAVCSAGRRSAGANFLVGRRADTILLHSTTHHCSNRRRERTLCACTTRTDPALPPGDGIARWIRRMKTTFRLRTPAAEAAARWQCNCSDATARKFAHALWRTSRGRPHGRTTPCTNSLTVRCFSLQFGAALRSKASGTRGAPSTAHQAAVECAVASDAVALLSATSERSDCAGTARRH